MPKVAKLKRTLSLPLLTFYGLGNILGAGIYVLVGEVAARAGMFTPMAFMFAAVIGAFTALTYAELSSRFPKAAGPAIYAEEAFHWPQFSTIVGLISAIIALISSATLVEGFTGYFQLFFPIPAWIIQVGIVTIATSVAIYGIKESAWAATAITLLETFGLLFIIGIGYKALATLPERWPELVTFSGSFDIVVLGAFVAFFAFIGFEDIVNVAEEVQNPKRNLPLAIIIALVVSTIIYMLVTSVAVLSLPMDQLAGSATPLASVFTSITGKAPTMITIISLFAIINGILVQVIMASRVFYGLAKQCWLPQFLSVVNERTRTPIRATILSALIVLGFALWLPLGQLAELTSFAILSLFTIMNLALVYVKKNRQPEEFNLPFLVPVIGLVTCAAILIFRITMI